MLLMISVFVVEYSIQLSWQLKLQNTGGKSRDRRLMDICQTLCLTKYSNIILGSRIPTHALKVHLSGSFFLHRVAGAGWFPWWLSVQHNPGHWRPHSGAAKWQLWQDTCYLSPWTLQLGGAALCGFIQNNRRVHDWGVCWLSFYYNMVKRAAEAVKITVHTFSIKTEGSVVSVSVSQT